MTFARSLHSHRHVGLHSWALDWALGWTIVRGGGWDVPGVSPQFLSFARHPYRCCRCAGCLSPLAQSLSVTSAIPFDFILSHPSLSFSLSVGIVACPRHCRVSPHPHPPCGPRGRGEDAAVHACLLASMLHDARESLGLLIRKAVARLIAWIPRWPVGVCSLLAPRFSLLPPRNGLLYIPPVQASWRTASSVFSRTTHT